MLTDPEYKYLRLRAQGLTPTQAQAAMGLGVDDACRMIASIREKLALSPTADLGAVARAMARVS